MKNIRRFVLVSAALVIGSSVASASSVFTDTFTFGPGAGFNYNLPNPIGGSTTFAANLQMFDDNLLGSSPAASLQNIAFILSVTDGASASVTNSVLSCTGAGCTPGGDLNLLAVGGSVPVSVSGPSGVNTSSTPEAIQSFASPGHVVQNIFTSCVGFTCTVDNTRIYSVTGLSVSTSSSTNVSNTLAAFAPYHQAGGGAISNLNITVGPSGVIFVGDAGLNSSATSNLSGSLEVIYTYTTGIPEPATAALLGSALLGLGMVLRRKGARK